jgi:hypothetical protein
MFQCQNALPGGKEKDSGMSWDTHALTSSDTLLNTVRCERGHRLKGGRLYTGQTSARF